MPGVRAEPSAGWTGGFSCVLGNPPWEHIELKEQEFFLSRATEIAEAAGVKRKKLIDQLSFINPELAEAYVRTKRQIDGMRHFASDSGLYPLCGRGRIKTDPIFAEHGRRLLAADGRFGMILPTGIATDANTQHFFKDLVQHGSIASLYSLVTNPNLWSGIGHNRYRFSLLTLAGNARREPFMRIASDLLGTEELDNPQSIYVLTPEEINLLNPNTGTCPVFRVRRDAEITLSIYRRFPVLVKAGDRNGNPWGVSLMQGLFNMTSDSHLFHTSDDLERDGWTLIGNIFTRDNARMLPLYEGRMGHQYSHRFSNSVGAQESTPTELEDAGFVVQPQYWIDPTETLKRQQRRRFECVSGMLGHRRVARNNDERSCIATIIPWGPASYGWILSAGPTATNLALLEATFNAFAYDYTLRNSFSQPSIPQSTSEQVPVPSPQLLSSHARFIIPRVLELTYTAYDMVPFANDLGDTDSPFRWDEDRRAVMRAELDALFFHLYGIARDDVDYIMETFPIVKRKDVAKYGSYRTKDMILDLYDRMAAAGLTLETPVADPDGFSSLNPPPGQGPRHPAGPNATQAVTTATSTPTLPED